MARSVGWLAHRLAPRLEVALHGACMGSGIELPAFTSLQVFVKLLRAGGAENDGVHLGPAEQPLER